MCCMPREKLHQNDVYWNALPYLGRPGRFKALQRFLDYIEMHDHVWVCRRQDIAEYWYKNHINQ